LTFIPDSSQLLYKAEVVFVEEADVVDVVPQHRDALDTEAPREARVALRVDAAVAQNVGVDHTAAADLEPAVAAAAAAPAPATHAARAVELEGGLGVREVRRPDPDAPVCSP